MSTDAKLLEAWMLRRDADAFRQLVARYADLVFNACRRVLQSDVDAEDVAQDCFVKLARATQLPRSSFAGWLHAMATNGALDFLRSAERRRKRERKFASERARVRDEAADRLELERSVDSCIAELPDELRQVVIAHFLEQRTQEDIASSIGVSRQTVTYRIGKGVAQVRESMKRRGFVASIATLTVFFQNSSGHAAPATLLSSLGRVALSGIAPKALVSSSTMAFGGFLMAKKLIVLLIVGSVLFLLGFLILRDPEDLDSSADVGLDVVEGSDALGNSELRDKADGEALEVVAAADGDAAADTDSLREEQGASLYSGVVRQIDGTPIDGARVVAASGRFPQVKRLAEMTTDAEGEFEMQIAGGQDLKLWAYRASHGLGFTESIVQPGSRVEIVIEPLASVAGKVFDQETGEGIEGLSLGLVRFETSGLPEDLAVLFYGAAEFFPELLSRAGKATTNAEGDFKFEGVAPMRFRFFFDWQDSKYVVPGFFSERLSSEIKVQRGETRENVEIPLRLGATIEGRVSHAGRPVENAKVELLTSYKSRRSRIVSTDAAGRFEFLGLQVGASYAVLARADGLAAQSGETIEMPRVRAVTVDLDLQTGQACSGRVVDADGASVEGVEVQLWSLSEVRSSRSPVAQSISDAEGRFHFEHVAAGRYFLDSRSEEFRTATRHELVMTADQPVDDKVLVVERRGEEHVGSISGQVVDAQTGDPRAAVVVWAKPFGFGRSDDEGFFIIENLPLERQRVRITTHHRDLYGSPIPNVEIGSKELRVEVVAKSSLSGRVVDEAGDPVEIFEICSRSKRRIVKGRQTWFVSKWSGVDSLSGEFSIEAIDPLDTEIHVRAKGYLPAKTKLLSLEPGANVEGLVVRLQRGRVLVGQVVDAATGAGVAGAHVRAHQFGTYNPWLVDFAVGAKAHPRSLDLTTTDAAGRFEFVGLPDEKVHLVAWKREFGPGAIWGVSPTSDVRLELTPAAGLDLQLSFEREPATSYLVAFLHRREKPWSSAFRVVREVSSPGKLEFADLLAGPYRMVVYKKLSQGVSLVGDRWIEVVDSARETIHLDIDQFASQFGGASGVVRGAADLSRVRILVSAARDSGEFYTYGPQLCEANGRFDLTGLGQGKYYVTVNERGQNPPRTVRKVLKIDGPGPSDVELDFDLSRGREAGSPK